MKACVIHKHGGVEGLKIEEVSDPVPSQDGVIVEVHSASLNHLDIWVRRGARGKELKMPHILGSDASGMVKETGEEVVVYPGTSCGSCEYCNRGEETECSSFGIIGMSTQGTFSEYIKVPANCIFPKPKHMNLEEASGFPLTFLTAWRMLMVKAKLKQGESILIHGIGGGVALAGLILSKTFGAKVIVTSSSSDKLSKAGKLGADNLINYKTSDVISEVKKITNSKGVDIVFDTVGSATWRIDFECVRKGGRIVLCGVTTGANSEINLRTLYWKQISVYGSTMGSRGDFIAMLEVVNAKKLKPVIDSVWPLEEIQSATKKMEEQRQFGKIVIHPVRGYAPNGIQILPH